MTWITLLGRFAPLASIVGKWGEVRRRVFAERNGSVYIEVVDLELNAWGLGEGLFDRRMLHRTQQRTSSTKRACAGSVMAITSCNQWASLRAHR